MNKRIYIFGQSVSIHHQIKCQNQTIKSLFVYSLCILCVSVWYERISIDKCRLNELFLTRFSFPAAFLLFGQA